MERSTRQRHALLSVLAVSRRSLAPAEICSLARQQVPRLNLSTVYRQLKRLLEEGSVARVEVPGQAPRYEAALSRRGPAAEHRHPVEHRHHFHCDNCDAVYPIRGCPGPMKNLAPRGFRVERHEVTLHGRCASCARPELRP